MADSIPQFMGVRIKRREDPALITGGAKFVADLQLEGSLHMAVIRSSYAHARVRGIDMQKALKTEGVVAVFTAQDVNPHMSAPLPALGNPDNYEVLRRPARYPLAEDKVRHVGDPLAAIVAEAPYTAVDAAVSVQVDYEPLPAITDPEEALEDGASVLHEEWDDNVAYEAQVIGGDVDRAFTEADVTVRLRLTNQRLIASAMEPRAVIARYDEAQGVTLWTTTQVPHLVRSSVTRALAMPQDRVRVIGPDVGGGFGSKAVVYPEEVLASFAAIQLCRPVKWVAGRGEDYQATDHGRDQINVVELAADADGRVQGLRLKALADLGAYLMRVTAVAGTHTIRMLSGPYRIPNIRGEITGVFTNKVPTEPYRGAGRPEASYLVERAMDTLADEMGIDPAELRRRNYISPDEFPYTTPTGLTYDSGDYAGALDRALAIVDYEALRREQGQRRREGGKLLGIGLASYIETCGMGPWETGSVNVEPDGSVTVRTGTMPNGQGHVTSWSQIVAETLQVPLGQVTVLYGDTDEIAEGIGTFASRSAAIGGSSIAINSEAVKEKAKEIAGHLLEAASADTILKDGQFHVRGYPERSVTWREIAQAAHHGSLPDGMKPGLAGEERFETRRTNYPFGTHVCVVEVEPETGEIKILRYVSVDDPGRVINPMIVEGQIHGGAAQGIGQALFEGAIYDQGGNLVTGSLMDYALPKAYRLPPFESHRTETPTPVNPLGAKGVGEAATIGSTPTVVNAVVDAVSHFGVRHLDMPLTPQRTWEALH